MIPLSWWTWLFPPPWHVCNFWRIPHSKKVVGILYKGPFKKNHNLPISCLEGERRGAELWEWIPHLLTVELERRATHKELALYPAGDTYTQAWSCVPNGHVNLAIISFSHDTCLCGFGETMSGILPRGNRAPVTEWDFAAFLSHCTPIMPPSCPRACMMCGSV